MNRGQPEDRSNLLHPGEHRDAPKGGEHRPVHHLHRPIKDLCQQVDHKDAHQHCGKAHTGECQILTRTQLR